jgi:hypothetical protein
MTHGIERKSHLENGTDKFRWRAYLKNPNGVPEESAAKLDLLVGLLQADSAADEFLVALRNGEYKGQPVQAFVQFFRGVLTDAERSKLLEDLKNCGAGGYELKAGLT